MTSMEWRRPLAAGIFLALLLGVIPAARGGQQADPQVRARLRERVQHLYLLRLTRALDLTEDQAAKIYPLLVRVEKDKAELQRQMSLDLGGLRRELAKAAPAEDAVLRLASRVSDARRAIRRMDEEVEDALDAVLIPVQKARYLLFTVEFLRNIGENLGRGGAGRPGVKRTS
ncbi:MAG TPA: hypothetical protein ENO03_09120 [Candidatus Aminicenantes bacterium]|nr:hypothetical protein [Candidatus Aminicenantes bacterium]HDT14492.1 hypothetical protein [Candidatus Aminicenantes bacterium]